MLDADQAGALALRPQRVQNVLVIIVQPEAPVRQPEHSVVVRAVACEQTRPAGRTGWYGVIGMPEHHA